VARGRWVVAREVEELLGERGLRQLDPVETFTCICGVGGRVDAAPVSVYVEWDQVEGGPPMYRMGLAHPRCRPSKVTRRPGMARALMAVAAGEASADSDAAAGFGSRELRPRAVLVWSPQLRAMTTSGPGKLHVDVWLHSHLEAGFRPLRDPLEVAELPDVAGWSLIVSNEVLRLVDASGDAAYEQAPDPDLGWWVELAITDGACLAVTGSELGLADALARGEWEAIGRAAEGERLVAGVVRVVVE
jgi:hypothetical protein